MQFEWNPEKAEANLIKHGVSFEEAQTVSVIFWREFLKTRNIRLKKTETALSDIPRKTAFDNQL